MGQSVLADNWSLQIVSELLTGGVSSETTYLLEVDAAGEPHLRPISATVVAFEALFDVITDIVLRDQILVDSEYAYAWDVPGGPFEPLLRAGVLKRHSFPPGKRIAEPREELASRMTTTPGLRRVHAANVAGWNLNRETPHRFESQIIWGGAGMLARAWAFDLPYTPHPVRKRFFRNAQMLLPDTSAADRLIQTVQHGRASLLRRNIAHESLMSLRVLIDPIPMRVIRGASSASDLLRFSLELRNDYQRLRDWLGEYQQWLTAGDASGARRKEAVLVDLLRAVDREAGRAAEGAATFTIDLQLFSLSFGAQHLASLRNRFGIRSMLNRLVFDAEGAAELSRLLGFFDATGSATAIAVTDHFSGRSEARTL